MVYLGKSGHFVQRNDPDSIARPLKHCLEADVHDLMIQHNSPNFEPFNGTGMYRGMMNNDSVQERDGRTVMTNAFSFAKSPTRDPAVFRARFSRC